MKTQVSKPITTAQIKKIHVLLQQKGLMDEKQTLIDAVSAGRAQSTKELTCTEGSRLIAVLLDENLSKKQSIYSAIWKLAWRMEIIYGETDDDYQMNRAKLNMFCRQRGTVKKNLSEQSLEELKKTHRQFEAMYSKHKPKVNKRDE